MNLGYPKMMVLSRIERAETLRKDAALSYKTKFGQEMSPRHKRLVFDSITWVVCEYRKDNRKMNDVFRRAALIALWWAKGVPNWNLFGMDLLIERLREFLVQEGADPAPKSNPLKSRQDIESVLAICKNPNWTHTCSDTALLDNIQHAIAQHWVCSESNHKGCFANKWCHFS
jgi:hypothetical protein